MKDLVDRNLTVASSPAAVAQGLARLAATSEQCFVSVGGHLERANFEISNLRVLFEKIETGLGVEASAKFTETIGQLSEKADDLRCLLVDFTRSTGLLESASRKVALQISDLDRVVRTIATLAITARVIGHALSPPEKKVAAFVENLSQMSREADTILSDVTASMAQIQVEMNELPAVVEKLSGLLTEDVLRHLSNLTSLAQGVQARGPALLEASDALRTEMAKVGADLGRVIMALQVGDAFRQRLGRVVITVEQSPKLHDGASICASNTLAVELLTAAQADTKGEVDAAVSAMTEIERSALESVRVARRAYLGDGDSSGSTEALTSGARHLDSKLNDVEEQLASLRERTERVVASVKDMFARERTLRQIAHNVRLSGLNAIIICTQLGSRANALREVAQWLRAMTDEADEATEGLQRDLSAMRELIEAVGISGLEKLSACTTVIVTDGHDLMAKISAAHQLVDMASNRIAHIGDAVPRHLQPARRGLLGFLSSMGQVDVAKADLMRSSFGLPQPTLPFDPESVEARHFDALRAGYTMAQERAIHDACLALDALEDGKTVVSKPEQTASDQSVDDLDDILF